MTRIDSCALCAEVPTPQFSLLRPFWFEAVRHVDSRQWRSDTCKPNVSYPVRIDIETLHRSCAYSLHMLMPRTSKLREKLRNSFIVLLAWTTNPDHRGSSVLTHLNQRPSAEIREAIDLRILLSAVGMFLHQQSRKQMVDRMWCEIKIAVTRHEKHALGVGNIQKVFRLADLCVGRTQDILLHRPPKQIEPFFLADFGEPRQIDACSSAYDDQTPSMPVSEETCRFLSMLLAEGFLFERLQLHDHILAFEKIVSILWRVLGIN